VEKLDLVTGEVLASFGSVKEAAASVGSRTSPICTVLKGNQSSCKGFFWRYCGSSELPSFKKPKTAKKPVEKLSKETGEVLESFESISQAAQSVGAPWSGIFAVLEGGNHRSCNGFFWRYQGSNALHVACQNGNSKSVEQLCQETGKVLGSCDSISQATASVGMPTKFFNGPIEKVHLRTAELLESFPSVTEGANSVGTTRRQISNVLKGKQRSCKSFFWRLKGSNGLPPDKPRRPSEIPVDKLCLETGEILYSFKSYKEAANSFGMKPSALLKVLKTKKGRSLVGFFWRFQGSTDLPTDETRSPSEESVEKLCRATGKVLESFVSLTEAAESVGVKVYQIRRVLQGKDMSCTEFFWRIQGSSKLPPRKRTRHSNTK
jgi:hypothetical protein